MSTWSFYRQDTGEFTGRRRRAPRLGQIPSGCGAVEGLHDPMRERVDLETGDVVAWESPKLGALQRKRRRREIQARIDSLERAQQRPIRELLIDPNNAAAKQRLAEIDAEIAAQRADLSEDGAGGG